MRNGVVLMMDALGFKGIWDDEGRDRAEDVLAKMQAMKAVAREDVQKFDAFHTPRAIFLSDTVIVGFEAMGTLDGLSSVPRSDALRVAPRARRCSRKRSSRVAGG